MLVEILDRYKLKMSSYTSMICRWKQKGEAYQSLIDCGNGKVRSSQKNKKKRTKKATTNQAKKTRKRATGTNRIRKSDDLLGSTTGLSIEELDRFTSHVIAKNVLDAANDLAGRDDHINGGIKIPLSVDFDEDGKESLFGKLMRETTEDGDSLRFMEQRLIEGINWFLQNSDGYSQYQVATAEMLQQQQHSDKDPQVPHQDLAHMVNEEHQQLQGVVMFTAGSQSTIVYDMSAVPDVVSPAQVAAQFSRIISPMPGCEDITQLLQGNNEVLGLLSKYGRLLFATNDNRPLPKIATTLYSVYIMDGNNPHCGPGLHPGADTRIAIFFTAKHRQANQDTYMDEQMSREKLMAHLVHNLRPCLMNPTKHITLTYLSQIWAEYVCNSASHNSFDGTAIKEMTFNKLIPKQAIKLYKKFCLAALDHHEKQTAESESALNLAKTVFTVALLPG